MAFMKIVLCAAAIFLPTSSTIQIQDLDSITIPKECRGEGFCSIKPNGYNLLEEKINSVLPEVFVKDYTDRYGEENPIQPPKLSPKRDWDNCPYETKIELMYTYSHDENNTKTEIIVQTSLFRQYLETVTCASKYIEADSEEQCFKELYASGLSAYDMKSTCQTMTARRTLYVYDIERSQIIQKVFDVPACCKCKVSYI